MVPRLAEMNDGPSPAQQTNGYIDGSVPSTSKSCIVDVQYVRTVGESVGVDTMTTAALKCASSNVMYVLQHVIATAERFAFHSRRTHLSSTDIDSALQLDRKQPQFGFCSRDPLPFRLVGSCGRDLYVTEDSEIELAAIINAPPPKIPLETALRAHWLAIDGEQPAVPENPVPVIEVATNPSINCSNTDVVQDDATRLMNALKGVRKTEQINVKTTTTHTLSLEQQVFFKDVTEAVMGNDDEKRTEALHSLQMDAGIQPLVARLSVAVSEGVKCNIVQHNLAILIYLMRMVQSLMNNSNISLDKCLHELLPAICSCVLSRRLCAQPESDNHWALREFASRLLAGMCRKYQVLDVQSRITRVLTRVWTDDNASLATLYGSLYALNELGIETIRSVVVPKTPILYQRVKTASQDRENVGDRTAADKMNKLATKVLIDYVLTQRPANLKDVSDYRVQFGGFGDTVYRSVVSDVSHQTSISTPQRVMKTVTLAPQMQLSPRLSMNASTQLRPNAGGAPSAIIPQGQLRPIVRQQTTYITQPAARVQVQSGAQVQRHSTAASTYYQNSQGSPAPRYTTVRRFV